MVDKVKPLKLEEIPDGSMADNVPTEANPAQDYTAVKGIALENQDTTLIDLDGSDNIQFTDPNVGTVKVADLLFGTEFNYAVDDTTSTTTSTTFQQKLRLTTTNLPLGNYIVFWSFEWAISFNNQEVEFRIQANDSIDINIFNPQGRADSFINNSGFANYNSASGVNTIDLDFRRVATFGTVSIRSARLSVWRTG